MRNMDEELTIKLTRYEVCELMLACIPLEKYSSRWEDYRKKLKRALEDFDERHEDLER